MNLISLFIGLSGAFAAEHASDASGGGAAHEHLTHVPWGQVGVQAFNLLILVGLLVYLLQRTVRAHFAHRASEYKELVERADVARRDAERGKRDIETRLNALRAGAEGQLKQARADGEVLRQRLMTEAAQLAKKMEIEAQRTARVELEKAKAALRVDVLERALKLSRERMGHLGVTEQQKLQNEFADKIQVVGG